MVLPLCSICFDDLERAADTINLNDLFGAVNELVENVKHLVAEKLAHFLPISN